jgi:hypothetical protein
MPPISKREPKPLSGLISLPVEAFMSSGNWDNDCGNWTKNEPVRKILASTGH